jgi:UDP-N-acetylglucosamine:LPS N-acetylglucosamine transferase
MDDYKVLILTAPSGHFTLARAVKSYLSDLPGVTVKMLDLVGENREWDFFRLVYRYFPFLMRIPFELTKHQGILNIWKQNNTRRLKDRLACILEAERPDLVITTYHGYIPPLDELKTQYRFKYINSITDPVDLHPILFSRSADYNIGFNEACYAAGRRMGIPAERIAPVGWFTAQDFFQQPRVDAVRQGLGLEKRCTLLICAGSEGTSAILMLLPAILFSRRGAAFQAIFITGHNPSLARVIKRSSALASRVNPDGPKVLVVEYTDRMNEYMSVSDVIIGKAGPNLIFESAVSGKPFIAITHISGNEDGNLRLIEEQGLGWVAENPITASRLIETIIQTPDILLHKTGNLEKMALKCREAGLFVRECVQQWTAAVQESARDPLAF